MVNKFSLNRTPVIHFGEGQSHLLPSLIKNRGNRVVVLTGQKSHAQNPEISQLLALIQHVDLQIYIEKIANEPSVDDIDRIVMAYHTLVPDVIVAIGGGSVIDAGKAVSAMLPVEGSIYNYLEGVGSRTHNGHKIFFIALPTTAGTGSEATANAVISQTGMNGFKRSLRHENLIPDIAIVDPVLTYGCPPDITAYCGMDAFTQLVESYLSVKANSITDAMAMDGIKQIQGCLVRSVKNGDDFSARSGTAYAALLSGITLANAGLGLTHGFASAIGGFFDVPHGVVCGTLMGIVNRFNIEKLVRQPEITIAHGKYMLIGQLLSGHSQKKISWYMSYVADYMENLIELLRVPRLGEYGIGKSDIEKIVLVTDHKSNPVRFDQNELTEMLGKRI